MRVLIVGGGGREHALAWKCAQSPMVSGVFVAPGNAGTLAESGVENVPIAAEDIEALAEFAESQGIDLTIVGPEAPLVMGLTDEFARRGLKCFGPGARAARLEGSKEFAKDFLIRHDIPTAAYQAFSDTDAALEFASSLSLPMVIKADGLAAGKGVVIAHTRDQAESAVKDMLDGKRFGEAGNRVVIEEFLTGEEASFICIVSGREYLSMASSQDHKAAYNGDEGPNTGGMGAYSPAPVVDDAMHQKILDCVIEPTVQGLADDGIEFTGFLYAGLMIGEDGIPKVLEFNCRFGDPETQPIMLRMESDLVEHCLSAVDGNLAGQRAKWSDKCALGVVLAAEGYPGAYAKGAEIFGLSGDDGEDTKIFHAGTADDNGKTVTAGGRVLCATALGENVSQAAELAYAAANGVSWAGCWKRDDIGHRAIARE